MPDNYNLQLSRNAQISLDLLSSNLRDAVTTLFDRIKEGGVQYIKDNGKMMPSQPSLFVMSATNSVQIVVDVERQIEIKDILSKNLIDSLRSHG